MMSKSEYARLNLTIPDVVKVIREQVLDEAIEAVKGEHLTDDVDCPEDTAYANAIDCAMDAIDNLKNK